MHLGLDIEAPLGQPVLRRQRMLAQEIAAVDALGKPVVP